MLDFGTFARFHAFVVGLEERLFGLGERPLTNPPPKLPHTGEKLRYPATTSPLEGEGLLDKGIGIRKPFCVASAPVGRPAPFVFFGLKPLERFCCFFGRAFSDVPNFAELNDRPKLLARTLFKWPELNELFDRGLPINSPLPTMDALFSSSSLESASESDNANSDSELSS